MSARAPARSRLGGKRVAVIVLALSFASASAWAQGSLGQDGGPRPSIRDRYRAPQQTQKLDENVRKLHSDDPELRDLPVAILSLFGLHAEIPGRNIF